MNYSPAALFFMAGLLASVALCATALFVVVVN